MTDPQTAYEMNRWLSVPVIQPRFVMFWGTLSVMVRRDVVVVEQQDEWPKHQRPLPRHTLCPLRSRR